MGRSGNCKHAYFFWTYHNFITDWDIIFFVKFAAAQEICVNHGGNLASITTLAEQKFISDTVKQYQRLYFRFWIGLNDLDYEGVFKWVDGKPYQLANWNTRSPRENDSIFFSYSCS